jgi:glutamate N-acetyltransferase/amino-acid N-acetyltransferase
MKIYENESCTFPFGFSASGVACGIKKGSTADLAMLVSDRPAAAGGVFTQNLVRASCIDWNTRVLQSSSHDIRGIVINSGNANAVTGSVGVRDNSYMATETARLLKCTPNQVLVGSTGVIGVPLPMVQVANGLRAAHASLHFNGGVAAASAIMTTDTKLKCIGVDSEKGYRLGGMAKGAGMIHPNMATMIAVITTDARIETGVLQALTRSVADRTFNCISIDGDTSTNDMFLVLANGASGIEPDLEEFELQLETVARVLSRRIVEDAEGATKLVEIVVSGAKSETDAKQLARTISTSLLVKTAIFGGDPNWGRVLAAAGRSGVLFNPERVTLSFGGIDVLENGEVKDFDACSAHETMQNRDFRISMDLGMGNAKAVVLTSDLSHDYVSINASYRT